MTIPETPFVSLNQVSKTFLNTDYNSKKVHKVIDNVSMDIPKGKLTTIFGPNGSGKTTILNIIAGILKYDHGSIAINNQSSNKLAVGFVYQQYYTTLMPWFRCIDNIDFPLRIRGINKKERELKVNQLLRDFQINPNSFPLMKYPYQLSGGQNQLAVILRALIVRPDLLIMDEPSRSLDYHMKIRFGENLLRFLYKNNITTVMVSHDIDELLFLSDRIVLLSETPSHVIKTFDMNISRSKTYSDFIENYPNILATKEMIVSLSRRSC